MNVPKICWEGSVEFAKGNEDNESYDLMDSQALPASSSHQTDPPSILEDCALASPSVDYPEEFLCPISLCVMTDPVIAQDTITYERSSIEKWLKAHGTSPHTRETMDVARLTPNRALLASIQSYRKLAEQMETERTGALRTGGRRG